MRAIFCEHIGSWRALTRLLAAIAILLAPASHTALAQKATFFTVSYIEVGPVLAKVGALALRNYVTGSKNEVGTIDVMQRVDRPNQFVVLGAWADRAAYETHAASEPSKKLGEKLATMLASPIDVRENQAFSIAVPKPGKDTVVVVTHVDIMPPQKDSAAAAFEQVADESRKHAGNLQFDVLQQDGRPNHFTVIESWASRGAFDLHQMQKETREFRAKLGPMMGALYDERLYKDLK